MIHAAWKHPFRLLTIVFFASYTGCATIESHRQVEQPLGTPISSSVGGVIFRLNKTSDLPNVLGGRDIYGGKVDRGFAEIKLVGIENQVLILDVTDVSKQSSETTMDRYKHLMHPHGTAVDVQQNVTVGQQGSPATRLRLDTRQQRDITISGIRVNFLEVQPYSVLYTLEDLQSQ